jgi:hypothetical protein
VVLHDIEASVIEDDIQRYLRAKLAEISRRFDITHLIWPSDEDVHALIRKAGKLFVYAATSVRFIGDGSVSDPRAQLDAILGLQEAPGATPFAFLDNLYLQLLHTALPKSNPGPFLERFQAVVGSIILLRDPLPLDALARFVKYDNSRVSAVLTKLHSVIIPPLRNNEAPRIYHPSFPDFLTNPSRCSDRRFTITVPTRERRLAFRCFELMSKSLRRDLAGIGDASLLNSEVEDFARKVQDAVPSELQYACRYWASHLSCVEHGDKAVMWALRNFSMQSLLWWFEAMSLIGSTRIASGLIQEAHRWAVCALMISE